MSLTVIFNISKSSVSLRLKSVHAFLRVEMILLQESV